MAELLRVENVRAGYGDAIVLEELSFALDAGSSLALLGRNGMGKTSTVRHVLGLNRPRGGSVHLRGQNVTGLPADQIARLGVAVVPEGRQIFTNLSVEENLLAFAAHRNGSAERWTLPQVYAQFPRLQERRRNGGGQLSGGEQQMLAIGRALMTNPHLLILDEATEGLAPLIVADIWRVIGEIRKAASPP